MRTDIRERGPHPDGRSAAARGVRAISRPRAAVGAALLAGAGGVIIGVALVGATGAPAPPAGDQLAVEWAPTTVARQGGIAAWSTLDPGTGRYNLVVHQRGGLHRLAVASRSVPFDVDVGVDRRGDPILTYSRCRVEPRLGRRAPRGIPLWDTARGCDIYVLSLARAANAAEMKVDDVSSGRASEFLPSVSRGSIGFARRYEKGGGRGRVVTHVYVGRLRGGSSRHVARSVRGRSERLRGVKLDGRRLATLWQSRQDGVAARFEARMTVVGDRTVVLSSVADRRDARYAPAGVNVGAHRLYWGTSCEGAGCAFDATSISFISRRRFGGPVGRGSVAFVAGDERLVWSAPSAVDAVDVRARATTGVVNGQMRCRAPGDPRLDIEPGCRIVREPLRFGPPSA